MLIKTATGTMLCLILASLLHFVGETSAAHAIFDHLKEPVQQLSFIEAIMKWEDCLCVGELVAGFLCGLGVTTACFHYYEEGKRKKDGLSNIGRHQLSESCGVVDDPVNPGQSESSTSGQERCGPEVLVVDGEAGFAEAGQLHDYDRVCKKNPGHTTFIPVANLGLNDLPGYLKHPNILNYLRLVIRLTVRVVAPKLSSENQTVLTNRKTFGSGVVCEIVQRCNSSSTRGQHCPCSKCEKLPKKKRKKLWGKYLVWTARHVVPSHEVGRNTICDKDFDDQRNVNQCPVLVGVKVKSFNLEEDSCQMVCIAHRKSAQKIEQLIDSMESAHLGLIEALREADVHTSDPIYAVCVSHPHGMAKHITFGEYMGDNSARPYNWTYDTATCPSSSGAPVCVLGRKNDTIYGGSLNVHYGSCNPAGDQSGQRNESGGGWRLH